MIRHDDVSVDTYVGILTVDLKKNVFDCLAVWRQINVRAVEDAGPYTPAGRFHDSGQNAPLPPGAYSDEIRSGGAVIVFL